jgi:hypothetical protein
MGSDGSPLGNRGLSRGAKAKIELANQGVELRVSYAGPFRTKAICSSSWQTQ